MIKLKKLPTPSKIDWNEYVNVWDRVGYERMQQMPFFIKPEDITKVHEPIYAIFPKSLLVDFDNKNDFEYYIIERDFYNLSN